MTAPYAPPMVYPWHAVRRLLVVCLDDTVDPVPLGTPALAAVRDSLAGVHVTLLAAPAAAASGPHLALVDEVWNCAITAAEHDEAALIERLGTGRFDAAVIFAARTRSALPAARLCRSAGIPLRLAHSRENPCGLLTDWVREADAGAARREAERQLALVEAVGFRSRERRLQMQARPGDRPLPPASPPLHPGLAGAS